MEVMLNAIHYTYIIGIIAIIIFMVNKKETSMICILSIFAVGIVATASVSGAIAAIFNSFIIAISELAGTILIISVVTALCKLLEITGINERMVSPITRFIRNPASAYWVIGGVMLIVSMFFWPSPAIALIGAVFLPVALRAKLPAIGAAVAMNLFGHGIALSSDLVIQGAPKLTADGAGIAVSEQIAASIPLIIVMGVVTTVSAYFFLMRDIKKGKIVITPEELQTETASEYRLSPRMINLFALVVPLSFAADVAVMMKMNLQGGDATALVGGTSLLLLILIAILTFRGKSFGQVTDHIVDGFSFGFRVFGPVIPIAAFFYLGGDAFASVFGPEVLPQGSSGLVNDLGMALSTVVPVNKGVSALTATSVGVITGLDGSGFSGLNLAGSVARIFSVALGYGTATLSALGQIGAVWVGGGTVIPWAVIPVAAICKVSPVELAARNLKPVAIGLAVTTVVGMFLLS